MAYVVVALVSDALGLGVVWGSVRLSWRAGNRLRERLAAHALRLEQAWHGRHSPGQLIERIDGDVEAMVVFFSGIAVADRRQRGAHRSACSSSPPSSTRGRA